MTNSGGVFVTYCAKGQVRRDLIEAGFEMERFERPPREKTHAKRSETMKMNRFNVRGYMLVIQEGCLLLSDEVLQGDHATKFPGGGLEYGEGLIECILREALEELGQEVEVLNHFYTTDFCQPSVFRPEDQMISVYYTAKLKSKQLFIQVKTIRFRSF